MSASVNKRVFIINSICCGVFFYITKMELSIDHRSGESHRFENIFRAKFVTEVLVFIL